MHDGCVERHRSRSSGIVASTQLVVFPGLAAKGGSKRVIQAPVDEKNAYAHFSNRTPFCSAVTITATGQ
jgi:hypothetical protein